jgi:hypothetical protein
VNRVEITGECVSRYLEFSGCGLIQFLNKDFRIVYGSPSEVPSENQFRSTLKTDEAICVAKFGVASFVVFFLASNEPPNLVTLNIRNGHVTTPTLKQPLATIPRQNQNLHNRVLVNASEPLNRADRTTFNH